MPRVDDLIPTILSEVHGLRNFKNPSVTDMYRDLW